MERFFLVFSFMHGRNIRRPKEIPNLGKLFPGTGENRMRMQALELRNGLSSRRFPNLRLLALAVLKESTLPPS
jgi:hypothetical protein